MHLETLRLENFRSFANEEVSFVKGLTVLVGENNGGKSNLIDAIRLLTTPLSGRRELYCEQTDVRSSVDPRSFNIQATYAELNPAQQGRLISAVTDDTLERATFGLTYDCSSGKPNVRPSLWAGRFKAQPEAGAHEVIRHVYLPPLRDAKRALASGNPTRINALLLHFLDGRNPDEIARNLARTSDEPILKEVDKAVGEGLDILTAGVRRQSTSLGFNSDEKLIDIARDLRFKLADHGISPEDLQYSGLGYANLLYIATIAIELEKTDSADLTIFLVEEPEAHLHPQLQAAVLNYLEECVEKSLQKKSEPNTPAGHLQVVVATHSPNLSAWVPSTNLVFVRSFVPLTKPKDVASELAEGAAEETIAQKNFNGARSESRCIPLSKLPLDPAERRKVDRYLDVTKSALLFGGRVLLTEGIAEALLLPAMAEHFVLKGNSEAWRTFRSAAFVYIDGVDFVPYAKVLLSDLNGVRISDRVVIVTDGDKHTVDAGKPLPGQRRKDELERLTNGVAASFNLDVLINTYSLETELIIAGNEKKLREAYTRLHPKSGDKWDEAIAKSGCEQAKAIQNLFKNTPKGDFAQLVADMIAEEKDFVVPDYIEQAIQALVK